MACRYAQYAVSCYYLNACICIIANFVLGEKEVSLAKKFYARNRCSKQEICSKG